VELVPFPIFDNLALFSAACEVEPVQNRPMP